MLGRAGREFLPLSCTARPDDGSEIQFCQWA
jgi:hypothetical protein